MIEESYQITDPATMRALAHPLRQRIILELSVRHSARAADLAELVEEPANVISYHLRALAKVGLLEEAPELARDTRDRVWKLSHPEGFYFPPDSESGDEDPLLSESLAWTKAMLYETIPRNPKALYAKYVGAALLTRDEAKEMFMEVAEVLERWRKHGMDADAVNPRDPDRIFHNLISLVGNRLPDSKQGGKSSSKPEQKVD